MDAPRAVARSSRDEGPTASCSSSLSACETDIGSVWPEAGGGDGALRSRKSGSDCGNCSKFSTPWPSPSLAPNRPVCASRPWMSGERVASSRGLVMSSSGTSPAVSKMKKASPASPIFMLNGM
jgi:hypothetical protein